MVNTDRRYIDAKVAGIVYRYEAMLSYGDRLIYAWNLSLWQVLDRVMAAYCGLEDEL